MLMFTFFLKFASKSSFYIWSITSI